MELLVVVILLAVFAAIIIPNLAGTDDEAKVAAAYKVVRTVSRQIDQNIEPDGSYPANISVEWFQGFKLPINPLHPDHPRTVQDDIDGVNPNKWQPIGKTSESYPFWYNPSNGAFRIRVPAQATEAETLALYNKVNGTNANRMRDTSK